MTDDRTTPVPTAALAALWYAIDDARAGMDDVHEIEAANHQFDSDCDCEHCWRIDFIDRKLAEQLADAALAFRGRCEGIEPLPRLGPQLASGSNQ